MWNIVVDRIPGGFTFICTILSFVIPFTIYKINQMMHRNYNPPWKNEEKKDM